MKMNKLFASAAVAVVALSAVAPVATVNAADLPANTSDSAANDTTGNAKGTSTASVDVVDGFLSLDKVPDLTFAPAVQGAHKTFFQDNQSLASNDNASGMDAYEGKDGNSQGILQISDSRHQSISGSDELSADQSLGYNLSVSLGQFANVTSAAAESGSFVLNFAKPVSGVVEGPNSRTQTLRTQSDVSVPAMGGSTNSGATLLNVGEGNVRGSVQFLMDGAAGMSLTLPDTLKKGKYTARITWNLNAAPAKPTTVNDGNGGTN